MKFLIQWNFENVVCNLAILSSCLWVVVIIHIEAWASISQVIISINHDLLFLDPI